MTQKHVNEYQLQYPDFDGTPKAVIAAIALSHAVQLTGEEDFEAAKALLTDEWQRLYEQGIVQQKPKRNR